MLCFTGSVITEAASAVGFKKHKLYVPALYYILDITVATIKLMFY